MLLTHLLTKALYPKSRDVIAPKNDYGIRSEILIQPQFGFCYNLMKGLKFLYSSIGTIWIAKVCICACVCVLGCRSIRPVDPTPDPLAALIILCLIY